MSSVLGPLKLPNMTTFSPQNIEQLAQLESALDEIAARNNDRWIDFRRACHANPEPSGEEKRTSARLLDRLQRMDVSAHIPDRGVGVVAEILLGNATSDDPALAIRADIDALRMPDEKDVPYASQAENAAHACGHDVHQTIVLGVAQTLAELQSGGGGGAALPDARLRFLFQAAEETCSGAIWMIEDGYLKDVSCVLGIHVEPYLLVHQIGIRYGVMTAQVDQLELRISGVGGHTARPHNTTDPIHTAATLVSSLYQVLPRSSDVRDASVLSFGRIEGGSAANVIPAEVSLSGTLRTTDARSRKMLLERIQSTCDHLAAMTGNTIHVDFINPLGSVRNATAPTTAFETAARRVVGDDGVVLIDRPSMGGEDFAMYLDHCIGSQIRLGCATSLPWPHLHSPVFDVNEQVISNGVRTLTRTALLLASAGASQTADTDE